MKTQPMKFYAEVFILILTGVDMNVYGRYERYPIFIYAESFVVESHSFAPFRIVGVRFVRDDLFNFLQPVFYAVVCEFI